MALGYIVSGASHDNTFSKVVRSMNDRFEAPFEPIKAATIQDYSSGLATSDVQKPVDPMAFRGAPQAQCARSATIWASGRTRDPYFEILGAPRGIMVTPGGGFDI